MFTRAVACANLAVFLSGALFSQAVSPPAFEVAEIELVKPATTQTRLSGDYQNGRLTVHNATLQMLIGSAYGVRTDLITGGPNWITTDLFDVSAKTDPTISEADSRLMLRTLIEERFKLVTHHEQKPLAVFALIVAKTGPKLEPTPEGSQVQSGCRGTPLTCHKVSMSALAQMLPQMPGRDIDRPVVNLTGIEGYYEIKLSYGSGSGRSIFDAIDDLGLKLDARKHPIDYLVIDHADRLPE